MFLKNYTSDVPVSQTIYRIEQVLIRCGVSGIMKLYGNNGEVTAITFQIQLEEGKPVPSPVTEIKRLLNPFLLDQDFLRNKSELERKQYFTEIFAVDTTTLDNELFNSQRDAQARCGTPIRAEDVDISGGSRFPASPKPWPNNGGIYEKYKNRNT